MDGESIDGTSGVCVEIQDAKTSAASAAGNDMIAATETPTASATVATFFWIPRERSSPSTVRNAPVPAIQARNAAIQPAMANAQVDAATALPAKRAIHTPTRTFVVFCQISRRLSVFESAVETFVSSADERVRGKSVLPEGKKSAIAAMVVKHTDTLSTLSAATTKTQEKTRKYHRIKFDLRAFVGMKYRSPVFETPGMKIQTHTNPV